MKPSREVIFGRKATRETWSARQESNEGGMRQGARPPPGHVGLPRGQLGHLLDVRPTPKIPINTETSRK